MDARAAKKNAFMNTVPTPLSEATMTDDRRVRVSQAPEGRYVHTVEVGPHRWVADEPASLGGADVGPAPYEWLKAGLGACTAMTLRMYAERKNLPLTGISVDVTHTKIEGRDVFDRTITLEGNLDDATRSRLLEIAQKCPVHKTLAAGAEIISRLNK